MITTGPKPGPKLQPEKFPPLHYSLTTTDTYKIDFSAFVSRVPLDGAGYSSIWEFGDINMDWNKNYKM